MTKVHGQWLILFLFAFSSVALAEDQTNQTKSNKISDAQITETVMTVHELDVDAGKLARSKSQNPRVKEFANQMISDHGAGNREAKRVAKKANIRPRESDDSMNLKKESKDDLAKLDKLTGDDFDKAYIDHEVKFHQTALDTIDKELMPQAKNKEVKSLISKVRPEVSMHLQHAKDIQQSMQSTG